MIMTPWIALPTFLIAALAALLDVRTRRIPNLLTGPALAFAVLAHAAANGGAGLESALLGALLAAGLLLPGWLSGWMGAGDVKLMGALGAWLGREHALVGLLATLLASGVYALVLALRHGALLRSVRTAAGLGVWLSSGARLGAPAPATSCVRFPFAVPALVGAVIALLVSP